MQLDCAPLEPQNSNQTARNLHGSSGHAPIFIDLYPPIGGRVVTQGEYAVAAALVEAVHAASMVAYFVGLPLLFVRRWPRLSRVYAVYAVSFVVLSQGAQLLFGHCFLTPIAGELWDRSGSPAVAGEWFTVRLSKLVFHSAPSERTISRIGDAAVLITAVGTFLRRRSHADRHPVSARATPSPIRIVRG